MLGVAASVGPANNKGKNDFPAKLGPRLQETKREQRGVLVSKLTHYPDLFSFAEFTLTKHLFRLFR